MSVKVSSWVWHGQETSELVGSEMVLLLALADVADDSGRCRFMEDESDLTYSALAVKARVSKSTMIRIVAKLRDAGLIEHRPGVKGRPNEFRVLVPWAARSGVNLEPNAVEGDPDSVSSGEDSVSSASTFGVKPDSGTSLIRIDVLNVDTSDAEASDSAVEFSAEVHRLCDLLADLVTANGHKAKVSAPWLRECDRLLRLDGYTVEQVEWVMRWACQTSTFWPANIRSMPKLREKFSTLKGQALADHNRAKRASTVDIGRAADDLLRAAEDELLAVSR